MNKIFFLFLCISSLISCFSLGGKSGADGLSLKDCMPERKNHETLTDLMGKIELVANVFVIVSSDKNGRYAACNLPDSYKKAGIEIKFSLVKKEIFSNERLIATPAILIKIEKSE